MFLGKDPSFVAEVAKSVGHGFEENLTSMHHQREALVVAILDPILLLNFMVASFHPCSTSPVIHTATMMPWNASMILWELLESPSLSSSAGSSSGPIALPLAIDLRAFFVLFATGGSPSDRATGFADMPSITVPLRAAEVVLSKEAKNRLHLARISLGFRRSFPRLSLIYCVLPIFLTCHFHPPLRCPYQPLRLR